MRYEYGDCRWKPFDTSRNWPDLGPKFKVGEDVARAAIQEAKEKERKLATTFSPQDTDSAEQDKRDLDWSAVLKRTFESYVRGERPNMYGEWLQW